MLRKLWGKFGITLTVRDDASGSEVAQLRSAGCSLGWKAQRRRPDLRCHVSRQQAAECKASVKDLIETNHPTGLLKITS